MNVSALIGLRYYRSRSSNRFVSIISLVSFLGLVLGVVALIVVVSVMNGFDRELKHRILGAVPHLVVDHLNIEDVKDWSRNYPVAAVTPFQQAQLLLLANGGSHLILVYGVDPALEENASTLVSAIDTGSIESLNESGLELILGRSVARRLGIEVGDRINLVVPRISAGGETVSPYLASVQLTGTLNLGSELDYRLGVMHLSDLQQLTLTAPKTRVTFTDLFAAPLMKRELQAKGIIASDWTDQFGDFFQTVRMEKVMMFILLSFVVAIASFSIISGLTMLVDSKKRDIAVLRTMGLSEVGVLKVFLVQGLGIAIAGVSAGLLIGIPLAFYTPDIMDVVESWIGFSIVAGTYFDQIPSDVRWPDILVIAGVTFLISFAATLYPSFKAARLHPAEILRYE